MAAGAWEMDILAPALKITKRVVGQSFIFRELVWGRLRRLKRRMRRRLWRRFYKSSDHVAFSRRPPLAAAAAVFLIPSSRGETGRREIRRKLNRCTTRKQRGALFMHDLIELTGFVPRASKPP